MEEEFWNEVNIELLDGEEVLWTGNPDFEMPTSDYIRVLWTIFYIICLIGFIFIVFRSIYKQGLNTSNVSGIIFLVVLGIIALCSIWKLVFEKQNIRKYTLYAITNKRVIVALGGYYKEIIEKHIDDLTDIYLEEMSTTKPGRGTIVFGDFMFQTFPKTNYGYNKAKKYSHIGDIPIFNDIDNVTEVFIIAKNLMDKK